MQIAVLVKPVPEPGSWKEIGLDRDTKTLNRTKTKFIVNPLDRHAVELALQIKHANDAKVSAFSMAPLEARESLMGVLALGVDEAYLLADQRFRGSDTLATARVLSTALKQFGPFDLIIAGAESIDGSTAQVGPQCAALMGLPFATFVEKAWLEGEMLNVSVNYGLWRQTMRCRLPALITVSRAINGPRTATAMGIIAAASKPLHVLSASDLKGLDPALTGLDGSPTRMGAFRRIEPRSLRWLEGSMEEKAVELARILTAHLGGDMLG